MNSMTGFGKATSEKNGLEITIEIKTVNHRFLDLNLKLPKLFSQFEDNIRKIIQSKITRGRTDVFISYVDKREIERVIGVDENLSKGYVNVANLLSERFELNNDLTVSQLMRLPDVLRIENGSDNEEEILSQLSGLLNEAIDMLNNMRKIEGDKLVEDIENRILFINGTVEEIKKIVPKVVENYREKMRIRIKELLDGVEVDEARLLNEVAFFADKSNIDEEIVRLKSHTSQLCKLLRQDQPNGRKIDFLVQELNREANTICSKANDVTVTGFALDLKAEIEKIREQIQNLE